MSYTKTTNFHKHLYFENKKDSREYQLNKCIKVLELISILKDKNDEIRNFSELMFGKNKDGKTITNEKELNNFNKNVEMINRLKKYYNYCISKLKPF